MNDVVQNSEIGSEQGNYPRIFLALHYALIILIFLFNFLGLPITKYLYLGYVVFCALSFLSLDYKQALILLWPFLFFEGQGRVLWSYASWARIIFDMTVMLLLLRVFIIEKKITPAGVIPTWMKFLIACHFLWFTVQLFQGNTSLLGAIATTKLFIYPFFIFFFFTLIDFKISGYYGKHIFITILLLLWGEAALSIYQMSWKMELMRQMSDYYMRIIAKADFAGETFRPFGTTHLPGAISIYFIFLLGMMLLRRYKSRLEKIVFACSIVVSTFIFILAQVRAQMVKFVVILIVVQGLTFMLGRRRKTLLRDSILATFFMILSMGFVFNYDFDKLGISLNSSISRVESLLDRKVVTTSRINLSTFSSAFWRQITEVPLGLGLGSTYVAASVSGEDILLRGDHDMAWTYDNLAIAIMMELGVGGLIYLFILLSMPFLLIFGIKRAYQAKDNERLRYITTCAVMITVLLIGNWGAVGIIANPESMMFWFFSGVGLKKSYECKRPPVSS